jgi:predicted metalloprotease with PDZ domain
MRFVMFYMSFLFCCSMAAQVGSKPSAMPLPPVLPEPHDRQFRGTVQLSVDATDTCHSIFRVRERIPLQGPGDLILLYPEWETGSHAPTASAIELAGLQMQIDGKAVAWHRDVSDVHAFHLIVPEHAKVLLLSFDYLSSPAASGLCPKMISVPWHRMLLYPAGWYARNIRVAAELQLPAELHPFTALKLTHGGNGLLAFEPETLDRLVDAPVYAARYTSQIELASSPAVPVHLDLIADAPGDLAISPAQVASLQALVLQTAKVFGPPPFRHYDALVSLSDELSPGGGLEHLDEGENNLPANYFSAPGKQLNNDDLIAHEYVHAWNGRFRQPAGLWSPTFNRPTDPSLLWVYEGQTEFWGRILAARAGLRTPQQTLDKLALDAALVSNRPGRAWKTLSDSTLDVLYMPRHTVAWRDWQRREDYYPEGVLLWLDVEAHLRELSHEKYGLDDFAQAFFATHGSVETISTYNFNDVCDTLNALEPADWKSFLEQHLLTHDTVVAMAGLARTGWRLTYDSNPTETFLQDEAEAAVINLDTSLGAQFRSNGAIRSVVWDGPAFRAGLAPGKQILAINGHPFSRAFLLDAANASESIPVRLTIQDGDSNRDVAIPYTGKLRYPHLERIPDTPDRLTPLIAAR